MEGQRLHSEYRAEPQPVGILAQRPHVAVRFGREQRARQVARRVHVVPQIQPAEIVLIEPGGESGPVEDKQQQHGQHTPGAVADLRHPLIVTYGDNETMQPEAHEIAHVSDTALMTAACRAMETERPDGLIRDPFAAQLAGDRGMAIARALDRLDMMCFGIGIRSRFLDQLVLDTVSAHGIATVLSVGAGLDTRPWRLELPATLRWIEVDFPAMLDYKDGVMACRRPEVPSRTSRGGRQRCVRAPECVRRRRRRPHADDHRRPADVPSRRDHRGSRRQRHCQPLDAGCRLSGDGAQVHMDSYQSIENVRAADHLDGLEILDVLHRHGWTGLRCLRYAADVDGVCRGADHVHVP